MDRAKLRLDDLELRLESGLLLREAAARARRWWDDTGRRLFANQDWQDPDHGIASGITRGLTFDQLTREEVGAVIEHWHEQHVMALMPAKRRHKQLIFASTAHAGAGRNAS
jgi:hypothetical protein